MAAEVPGYNDNGLKSGIECVLFDAVGTLIFPDPCVAEAYRGAAK